MRRLVSLVALVALAAGACGSGSAGSTASSLDPLDVAPGPGVVARSMAGELSLEVGGAITATWSGTTAIQILTSVGGQVPEPAWLLSVGLLDPVQPEGAPPIRPAFDLLGYRGDGDYTVAPPRAEVRPEDAATAVQSDAFVMVGSADDVAAYAELLEPCALSVERKGEAGEITCPRVTGPAGEISFTWSWDAHELLTQEAAGDSGASLPTAGAGAAATQESEGGQPSDGATESEATMPLEVRFEPSCVRPGAQATATISTEPAGSLAMAVAFDDARTYGLHQLATADDQGHFSWTFVVPLDAPDGPGHFLVTSGSADGERAAKHIEDFEVKRDGC